MLTLKHTEEIRAYQSLHAQYSSVGHVTGKDVQTQSEGIEDNGALLAPSFLQPQTGCQPDHLESMLFAQVLDSNAKPPSASVQPGGTSPEQVRRPSSASGGSPLRESPAIVGNTTTWHEHSQVRFTIYLLH